MQLQARATRMWRDRKVLNTLVRRDLRVRYAKSVLGYLWTLIDPLALGFIYFFIFGIVLNANRATPMPFIIFLLAGLLPWNWFNATINETARALSSERKLVRSTNIPREFWVVRVVLAKGVEFLLSLPVLAFFVVLALLGVRHINDPSHPVSLNWQLILIFPAIAIQLMLCIGLGLVMAPLAALADDFVRIVRIILRMQFYMSAILYPMTLVEDKAPWAADLMSFNPMIGIIDMYRMGLAENQTPNYLAWGAALTIAVFWLLFGMWVFRRLEPAVLKEI